MKKYVYNSAQFIKSAATLSQCPSFKDGRGVFFPEIAVAGRSNVGKSSLLNDLFQRKKLVKTSNVPGKTQLINFFLLDGDLMFVDLPGYGFAKRAKSMKSSWDKMMEEYFQEREQLRLVLFLLDIRREPSKEDLVFFKWLKYYEKQLIVIFTKTDKLSKSKTEIQKKKILGVLGEKIESVEYSTLKKKGRPQLCDVIEKRMEANG